MSPILQYEGRKYCEHDFHVLFAPCCGKCGKLQYTECLAVLAGQQMTTE